MLSTETPALAVVGDSPDGHSFTVELPALPAHLNTPGVTWTLERVYIGFSQPRPGFREYREDKPAQTLVTGLLPGARHLVSSDLTFNQVVQVRAMAVAPDGRTVAETPALHLLGVNVLNQPNPHRRVLQGTHHLGHLVFCGFAPCGHYGEPGLRAVLKYPAEVSSSSSQILVQASRDGQTWETIEESRRDPRGRPDSFYCTIPVEPSAKYWLRAFLRDIEHETTSLDVLHLQVPADK